MPQPSTEERLVEVLRENAFLRQEIHFYRACYESSLTMEDKVYEVSQQLMLAYYFEPDGTVEMNQTAYRLAHDIYAAVDENHAAMVAAEESWMAFWAGSPLSGICVFVCLLSASRLWASRLRNLVAMIFREWVRSRFSFRMNSVAWSRLVGAFGIGLLDYTFPFPSSYFRSYAPAPDAGEDSVLDSETETRSHP